MSNLSELLPTGGGQNAVAFVASGDLDSGESVVLRSDGKVEIVSQSKVFADVGGVNTWGSGVNQYHRIAYDPDSNKVIIAYESDQTSSRTAAVVGTVSGTTITFGSVYEFDTNLTSVSSISVTYMRQNRVVITYRAYGGPAFYYAQGVVGEVSGTSISFGTPYVFESSNSSEIVATKLDNKLVIAYKGPTGGEVRGANISTTTNSFTSVAAAVTFYAGGFANLAIGASEYSKSFLLAYKDTSDSNKGKVVAGYLFSTGPKVGTATTFESSTTGVKGISIATDPNSNKVLIAYIDESNSDYLTVSPGEVYGTTATAFSAATPTVLQSAAAGNYTSTVFNPIYRKATVFCKRFVTHNSIYGYDVFVSSNTATRVGWVVYSEGGDYGTFTLNDSPMATYDTSTGNYIFVSNVSNQAGVYTAASTNSTYTDFIGLTQAAITNASTGTVNVNGGINTAQSGLEVSENIYLQKDGQVAVGDYARHDISWLEDDYIFFSVAGQETTPRGFCFGDSGTKMYVIGNLERVYQYNLTSAYDLTTASYASLSKLVSSESTDGRNVNFSPDGTKMYVVDFAVSGGVYQYSLSTPWAVNTATYDSVSVSPSTLRCASIFFKPDGSKLYVNGEDKIEQYSLSTAFDLSSASYDSISVNVPAAASTYSIWFTDNGARLIARSGDAVYQLGLSTNWDLSTLFFDQAWAYLPGNTSDIEFTPDGTKMFTIGFSEDGVRQFSTTSISYIQKLKIGQAISATTINMMDLT